MKITKLVSVFFPFIASDWTDQSDFVRGGVSFSKIDIAKGGRTATFSGELNTTILDAGFSSQRLTGTRTFDWSKFKGVRFEYETPDCNLLPPVFTLIIKDRLQQGDDGVPGVTPGFTPDPTLPPGPDTLDFEYNFKPECNPHRPRKTYSVTPSFKDFDAWYRGTLTEGTLNLKTVRRFQVMVRSFEELQKERLQDGKWKLKVNRIQLWK
ncbi:hypothetical protein BJ508DRAFT_412579 [Ascobolus immersus RN42]|uniref:NADH:ubiquinone oxidoreductase intermediate-associated protein 30 domain-containing protein n=1 Tax=Ascobolus immersus RN42 TaxID=1160509 RepID=A0A3N4IEC9_ASCIM|nr:hypothetical protein BJ508DRAFT_412579 [Ascobolus immersus RN42]